MVLDGNFAVQHKPTRRPGDDVALADGHAFMVETGPYRDHLRTAKKYTEVRQGSRMHHYSYTATLIESSKKLTCNEHRAVLSAAKKNTILDATGIGAAACSRHGFFIPHTAVDFDAGEG